MLVHRPTDPWVYMDTEQETQRKLNTPEGHTKPREGPDPHKGNTDTYNHHGQGIRQTPREVPRDTH